MSLRSLLALLPLLGAVAAAPAAADKRDYSPRRKDLGAWRRDRGGARLPDARADGITPYPSGGRLSVDPEEARKRHTMRVAPRRSRSTAWS